MYLVLNFETCKWLFLYLHSFLNHSNIFFKGTTLGMWSLLKWHNKYETFRKHHSITLTEWCLVVSSKNIVSYRQL